MAPADKNGQDRVQAILKLSLRLDAYSAIFAQTPPFLLIELNRDRACAMSAGVLPALLHMYSRLERCSFVQLTESICRLLSLLKKFSIVYVSLAGLMLQASKL